MSKKNDKPTDIYGFKCPKCTDGIIRISQKEYDLPDEDKMLIIKLQCDKCNFLKTDIIPMTTRTDPGLSKLKITEESDLQSKIYRSPLAKIEIPELELSVEPGPSAEFYFTNVEGVLLRFEKAVYTYINSLEQNDPEKSEIKSILYDLKKAIKGDFPFTLIIEDPGGGSYIIPVNKEKFSFSKLEIYNDD
ncbi:MAG: ZPR1 zinc finger domain-containing protein [Promethearchaeati archaeon]